MSYLNDDKIIAWFSQNAGFVLHDKLYPIPLGIINRYSGEHIAFDFIKAFRKKPYNKKHLLYVNFREKTCFYERNYVLDLFRNSSFTFYSPPKPFTEYLSELGSSYFALSPRGTGFDCHRTWECLYLETIPIVKSSYMDSMYTGLPVLIVNDWNEITERLLQETLEKIKLTKYNKEKLYFDYWKCIILSHKKKFLEKLAYK